MLKPHTVGIVGYGDFGKFLHELLVVHAPHSTVFVSSQRFAPDGKVFFPLEDVCQSDVLLLCVPISSFKEVIQKVKPLVDQHTIVCDVSTVKEYTVSVLREQGIVRYVATHPMFGPYSYEKQGNTLKGLRVAVCDSTLPLNEYAEVLTFLRGIGLDVLEMTPSEHDKRIAETLFLTHLVGQIVKNGQFERTAIDTLSFGFLMDAVESVAHDDELFRDVFTFNPYCAEVLNRFEHSEKMVIESLLGAKSVPKKERMKEK